MTWSYQTKIEKIHADIQKTYDEVDDLVEQEKSGKLSGTRGMSPKETLEAYIVNNLGKARDSCGNYCKQLIR